MPHPPLRPLPSELDPELNPPWPFPPVPRLYQWSDQNETDTWFTIYTPFVLVGWFLFVWIRRQLGHYDDRYARDLYMHALLPSLVTLVSASLYFLFNYFKGKGERHQVEECWARITHVEITPRAIGALYRCVSVFMQFRHWPSQSPGPSIKGSCIIPLYRKQAHWLDEGVYLYCLRYPGEEDFWPTLLVTETGELIQIRDS